MNKKTLILGVVLLILIALAYLYQGPIKNWQKNLGKPTNFLARLNIGKIDKIEVTRTNEITILEKQEKGWKIYGTKDFYAEKNLMDNLLESLRIAVNSQLEIVSNNKERKKEFGVDSNGVNVKIYEIGEKKIDFIVGKSGSDFVSSYISTPEIDATYSLKENLRRFFDREEWRDLTIFSNDKEKIDKIRFQYPNREFTIEKKDGSWQGTIPEKFSVSIDKIDKILNIMSDLAAVSIPEQTFKDTGLEKHLIIVQATGESTNNTLMVGSANKEGLYFAKKGDSDNIYLINKEQKDELDKWIWQLK